MKSDMLFSALPSSRNSRTDTSEKFYLLMQREGSEMYQKEPGCFKERIKRIHGEFGQLLI